MTFLTELERREGTQQQHFLIIFVITLKVGCGCCCNFTNGETEARRWTLTQSPGQPVNANLLKDLHI